jgi:hypothetical protein
MSNTNKNILDVDESLSEYYALKKKYISSHYDKYISPIVMTALSTSKLFKRRKFQELKKPLCINCSQPVGTIFERKYYEEYNGKPDIIVFTAKCGNTLNPCDLNIEIHKSLRESYDKTIQKANKKLNDIQLKIIKLKNKILFLGKGNLNEAEYIEEFNAYKDDIIYYTDLIGSYTEENIMVNDNPEDIDTLKNLIASLNQLEIIKFKEFIQEYDRTKDDDNLNKAVNMYVNEIIPKLKEIQQLKYKTNYVERDLNGTYYLVQSKYSLEGKNFYDENADEVVKFITGTALKSHKKKITIAKNKTLKTTGKTSKTKTSKKTLKIVEPEDDEDEDDAKDADDEVKDMQKPSNTNTNTNTKPLIDVDVIFEDSDEEEQKEQKEQTEQKEEQKEQKEQTEKKEQTEQTEGNQVGNKPLNEKVPTRMGKVIVLNEATEAIE